MNIGDIVRAYNSREQEERIVQIIDYANGYRSGSWRCDDGWVYNETSFSPATFNEVVAKRVEIQQSLELLNEAIRAGVQINGGTGTACAVGTVGIKEYMII